MRTKIPFFLLAVLLGSPAQAKDFWKEKEYRRWSRKECLKLLKNSPWAKQKNISLPAHIDPLQRGPAVPQVTTPQGDTVPGAFPQGTPADPTTRERQQNPRMIYQVQLRSALPIRQALVRLALINRKYDELSPEQQQAFDQQAERFLAVRFPETVVVYVEYGSNVQQYDREMDQHWRRQTTDTLKHFVFLMGRKGVKVPLLRYTMGEGTRRVFQLVFPRYHEGRPVLGPEDKSLRLEFPHPSISGQREERVFLEFKVKKMLVDGTVVY